MLEPRDELDLSAEPVRADAGARLVGQDLDDDVAVEPLVVRDEHARHPAAAQLAVHAVGVAEGLLEGVGEGGGHGVQSADGGTSCRTNPCVAASASAGTAARSCNPRPSGGDSVSVS